MVWLQSLNAIVIDPRRCPKSKDEFSSYEYERTKDGEIISGYPDANNHNIDAVRYATENLWQKIGNSRIGTRERNPVYWK
jgi:phage terminase large subunit